MVRPFLLAISEMGWTFKKKYHLESGLNQQDEDAHAFFYHTSARGPEILKKRPGV